MPKPFPGSNSTPKLCFWISCRVLRQQFTTVYFIYILESLAGIFMLSPCSIFSKHIFKSSISNPLYSSDNHLPRDPNRLLFNDSLTSPILSLFAPRLKCRIFIYMTLSSFLLTYLMKHIQIYFPNFYILYFAQSFVSFCFRMTKVWRALFDVFVRKRQYTFFSLVQTRLYSVTSLVRSLYPF